MNTMSVSRRKFAQLLGAGAAAVVVRPTLSFAKPTQSVATPLAESGNIVRLSANENPYGPSPKAFQAITESFGLACRYPDEHNNLLIDKLAKLNGVNHDQILLGDGSGEILKLCAETFTGPQQGKLIAADPTFEAILNNASANDAEVVKIPLTGSFGHDLPKMLCRSEGRFDLRLQSEQSHREHHAQGRAARLHRKDSTRNNDSRGRSVFPLRGQSRIRKCDPARKRASEPDCLSHVLENLRHGRITLRLLCRAEGND